MVSLFRSTRPRSAEPGLRYLSAANPAHPFHRLERLHWFIDHLATGVWKDQDFAFGLANEIPDINAVVIPHRSPGSNRSFNLLTQINVSVQKKEPAFHSDEPKEPALMKSISVWLLMAGVSIAFTGAAWTQQPDPGRSEYQAQCGSCHGIDGKGNGPISSELKSSPTDLTLLAKKNNGVFPISVVYEVIDGRKEIKAHGVREMPVWGYRYTPTPNKAAAPFDPKAAVAPLDPKAKAPIQFADTNFDPELVVRNRVLVIVDYLNRIQAK